MPNPSTEAHFLFYHIVAMTLYDIVLNFNQTCKTKTKYFCLDQACREVQGRYSLAASPNLCAFTSLLHIQFEIALQNDVHVEEAGHKYQ